FFAGTAGVLQQDNTNFFWDDTNNRLGIGTATPGSNLEIKASTLPILAFNTSNTADGGIEIHFDVAGVTKNYIWQEYQPAISVNDIAIGNGSGATAIRFGTGGDLSVGAGAPGYAYTPSTRKLSVQGFGATSATYNTYLTNSAATSLLVVRDDGNVGIGTTSPSIKLTVYDDTPNVYGAAREIMQLTDSTSFAAGVGGGLSFLGKGNTAGGVIQYASLKGIKENGTDGNYLGAFVLATSISNGIPTERLRVNSSGYLGIGNTSPTLYLQGPSADATPFTIGAGTPAQASASVAGNALTLTASNAIVGTSTTGAATGGAVTITAGGATGSCCGAGGAITITGGSYGDASNAYGGAVSLTGGAATGGSVGGSATIAGGSGPSGGSVYIKGGAGASGAINITTPNYAGNTGNITISTGDLSGNTTAVGNITIQAGKANLSTGSASLVPGGYLSFITQSGNNQNGSQGLRTAGGGGPVTFTLGGGGNETGDNADSGTGGNGGAYTITGGVGGAATGAGGTHTGGIGSSFSFTSGAGGNATGASGTRTGGNSGSITFDIGAVGTGATANGTAGNIILAPSRGNVGIGTSTFGTSAAKVLAIGNGTAPSTSIADGIQLWAEDVSASSELRVRDEAGNTTTLSPHNFSLFTPEQDYYLPWAYTSERDNQAINVDMYGAIQQVELLSGKHFIYGKNLETNEEFHPTKLTDAGILANLEARILKLETSNSASKTGTAAGLSTEALAKVGGETDDPTIQTIKLTQEEFNTLFTATLKTTTALHIYQDIIIDGNAKVAGTLTRGNEKAGRFTIPEGSSWTAITFTKPFTATPNITVTMLNITAQYIVSDGTKEGFKVTLLENPGADATFSWIALEGVSDASTTESGGGFTESEDESEPEPEIDEEEVGEEAVSEPESDESPSAP
ncbi:MAG: hypothetical protein O3A36_03155, partial [bacterium]|nr:hypothetical protein [bacterium]